MIEIAPIDDHLASWPRGGATIDQIVIHESVTSSRAKTIAVLRARKLGVHIIVDRDGSVTQHVPLLRQTAHAGSAHNRRSVAVEVVNRYYGSQADDGVPDIQAVWAHRGWYILPTPAQCESVWQVIVDVHEQVVTIPLTFPGVTAKGYAWGRLPLLQRVRVPEGVMAHHRTAHADGLFPEHYCWLRSLDYSPDDAYRMTVAAASSGKRLTPIPSRGVA